MSDTKLLRICTDEVAYFGDRKVLDGPCMSFKFVAGVAVAVSAEALIERHYSRYDTEGLDELVARTVVPIVSIAT